MYFQILQGHKGWCSGIEFNNFFIGYGLFTLKITVSCSLSFLRIIVFHTKIPNFSSFIQSLASFSFSNDTSCVYHSEANF